MLMHLRSESAAQQATDGVALVVVINVSAGPDAGSNSDVIELLVDRIKHRFAGAENVQRWVVLGDLVMDRQSREVTRGTRRIYLSPMEYALLEYLVLHPDRMLSEARLMDSVFPGSRAVRRFNTLWVHLHRLRKKVDENNSLKLIQTIRGGGYILRTPLA